MQNPQLNIHLLPILLSLQYLACLLGAVPEISFASHSHLALIPLFRKKEKESSSWQKEHESHVSGHAPFIWPLLQYVFILSSSFFFVSHAHFRKYLLSSSANKKDSLSLHWSVFWVFDGDTDGVVDTVLDGACVSDTSQSLQDRGHALAISDFKQ